MSEGRTITLEELLLNLHTMQARMSPKNNHRNLVRIAMQALVKQAEEIHTLSMARLHPEPAPLVTLE